METGFARFRLIMQKNLFSGGEVKKGDYSKGYFWVQTKLVRESGPWYTTEGMNSPDKVHSAMVDYLDIENQDKEHFIAVCLDRKNKVTAVNIISIGTVSGSLAHVRETFKAAIISSSSSIILVHNHPSGDPSPSEDDIGITKKFQEAGELLGIRVLDSIIIGQGRYISLAERRLM